MGSIVHPTDSKPETTIRKDWVNQQGKLPLIGEVPRPHLACEQFVSLSSWAGALRYAVQRCGRDDYEVAEDLNISNGYMSRVMRGTANLDGDRLVTFMRATGSVAPLQWLAEQMGFDIKQREPETEVERLRREVAELRRRAA